MGSNQELRPSSKTWKVSLDYVKLFPFFFLFYFFSLFIVRGSINEFLFFIFFFRIKMNLIISIIAFGCISERKIEIIICFHFSV